MINFEFGDGRHPSARVCCPDKIDLPRLRLKTPTVQLVISFLDQFRQREEELVFFFRLKIRGGKRSETCGDNQKESNEKMVGGFRIRS